MSQTTDCLIQQTHCGRIAGEPVCPKCGIRTDVRYVSKEDMDMAVTKGTALYWQNHAQAMERTIAAQEKVKREEIERAEIERAKAESARLQAQREKQEAEARRAQEKAERERLEREEMERQKAQEGKRRAAKERLEMDQRRKAEEARRQAGEEKQCLGTEQARRNPGKVFQDLPIAPQMVVLPSGSFLMGSASENLISRFLSERSETPQRKVTIAYKLAMGRYPVTFEEWDACVADGGVNHKPDRGDWGRGKRPVINVNWNEIQTYMAWLNTKVGLATDDPTRYRLPSEAEWEYACRAGSLAKWCFGDDEDQLTEYAWYDKNSGRGTQPVGQKRVNSFGLYDMHGNVWEQVEDCQHVSYHGAPSDGSVWVTVGSQRPRLRRGGCWNSCAGDVRAASRGNLSSEFRGSSLGFRLARTLP